MDPDEALRLIRLTIKQMRVDTNPFIKQAHAEEIADYFKALDEWLSKDGFLPADWASARTWMATQRDERDVANTESHRILNERKRLEGS